MRVGRGGKSLRTAMLPAFSAVARDGRLAHLGLRIIKVAYYHARGQSAAGVHAVRRPRMERPYMGQAVPRSWRRTCLPGLPQHPCTGTCHIAGTATVRGASGSICSPVPDCTLSHHDQRGAVRYRYEHTPLTRGDRGGPSLSPVRAAVSRPCLESPSAWLHGFQTVSPQPHMPWEMER